MEFKIEKNVPAPPTTSLMRWPFGEMEIGDSFTVPVELRERCRSAAGAYQRQHPDWKYTLQKENDTTWRLWRV